MIAASGAFGLVIDGQAASVDCRVTLTLPAALAAYNDATPVVESVRLAAALLTDAPEGTRIATGQSASSGSVLLGGPTTAGLVWALNPYNTASPGYRTTLEGSPILIEYGVVVPAAGMEWVTALVGTVDSYSVDMQSGTVELRVIERGRQAARGAVSLPSFLGKGGYHGDAGLTSGYVADAVLRSVGLHTSPPPRANALIYASMHGSLFPEVYDAANAVLYPIRNSTWTKADDVACMVPGKWGAEVVPGGQLSMSTTLGDATQRLAAIGADNGYMVELNIKVLPAAAAARRLAVHVVTGFGATPDWSSVQVWQLAGTTNIQFAWDQRRNGATASLVFAGTAKTCVAGDWVHCLAVVKYPIAAPTTIQLTGYMDTAVRVTAGTSRTIGALGATASDSTVQTVDLQVDTAMEGYQYALDLAPDVAAGFTFTPSAYMDASALMLTAVPDVPPGDDAWAVLQEFASAEQGAWVPDALGRPRFKSRRTLLSAAPARAVVGTTNLMSLTQEVSAAGKADLIRQPLTEWAAQPIGFAWEADQTISLEPYETRTMIVRLDYVAVDVYPWVPYADRPGGVFPVDATRFRISTTSDGVGSALAFDGSSVDIQSRSLGPSVIEVKLINRQAVKVYFVSPDSMVDVEAGTPYLKIGGRQLAPLTSGGTVVEARRGAASTVLELPMNRFLQTATAAQPKVDGLLSDLSRVRPVWRDVRIVADPRLQIGDKVTLTDLEVNGIASEPAMITSLETDLSDEAWAQTVTLTAMGTPGGWLLGVVGRSELGVTTYI